MDLPLVQLAADFTRRRRRAITLLAALGVAGYGTYKAYNLTFVVEKRRKLAKLLRALVSLAEGLTASADTISLISSDLNQFLRSDSDEIPSSLRQISKIACSDEFLASMSKVSEAVTTGIVGAVQDVGVGAGDSSVSFAEQMLDKVFSPAGTGFVSVVAGSLAKGLVAGVYADGGASTGDKLPQWAKTLLLDDSCRQLMSDSIERFVSTAVSVYLERTMQVNTYDQMFAGLTNPDHEAKLKDVLVSVCNGAVETLVKTSHEVLTSAKTGPSASASNENDGQAEKESESRSNPQVAANGILPSARSTLRGACNNSAALVAGVSSTLSVPSNRRFVLDVTGRVTFETVRSFLDFFMSRMYESSRVGMNLVRQEVVRKGIEVVRYVGAKSMLILTACLSICLHLLFGSKLLIAA